MGAVSSGSPATQLTLALPAPRSSFKAVSRAIDVVGAAFLLAVLSPLILLVHALVVLTSSGPVFFRQMRVGVGGKLFEVIKFRTMVDGTHLEVMANSQLRAAYEQNDFKLSPDDPRITRVGGFLRRTSLDELPQLVNILRGEMSLVGVRSLLANELALRSRRDQDLYALRRPGLTGLWQVEGRSAVGEVERLELDRGYLEDWSVLTDLRILSRTPRAVIGGSGAH
jgi:lipopolysaccharide/colanic/teichoic acid biosynthesis glycosyltransferase